MRNEANVSALKQPKIQNGIVLVPHPTSLNPCISGPVSSIMHYPKFARIGRPYPFAFALRRWRDPADRRRSKN